MRHMRDDTIESVAEQSASMQPSINVHATYIFGPFQYLKATGASPMAIS